MSVTKEEMQKMIGDSISAAVKPLNDAMAAKDAQIAEFTKRETDRAGAERTAKIKANREAGTKLLEDAVKAGSITPAQREAFSRSLGLDNDDRVLLMDVTAITAMLPAGNDRKEFSDQGRSSDQQTERKEKDAGAEIARLAKLEQESGKVSYSVAHARVVSRNTDLAREWLNG